jgi:hypothetical protein
VHFATAQAEIDAVQREYAGESLAHAPYIDENLLIRHTLISSSPTYPRRR